MNNKILLHSCCAPCSTSAINSLELENFSPIIFWYNPNIEPFLEHQKRLSELEKLTKILKLDSYNYSYNYECENKLWHQFIAGLENEKEGGKRCAKCFEFRLKRAQEIAANNNLQFTTTLTVSKYKNSRIINSIGEKIDQKSFRAYDFKENDGYKKSIILSKEYKLYRQNYCGCLYSKKI